MAGGVNKVILVGNLGADPEVRQAGEKNVCELRLATNQSWTDEDGQKQERVEWHRIVVWGKIGRACAQYLSKGRQIYLEGRIQTRTWDDKDGNKRYTTEIVANDIQFLGGRGDDQERRPMDEPSRSEPAQQDGEQPGAYPDSKFGRNYGQTVNESHGGYGSGGGYGTLASGDPDDDIPF